MVSENYSGLVTPPPKVLEGKAWQYVDKQPYNARSFSLIYIEPKNGYFYCVISALDKYTGVMLARNSIDIPFDVIKDMVNLIQRTPLDKPEQPFLDLREIPETIHWELHPTCEIEYEILYYPPAKPNGSGRYKVRVDYARWSEYSPEFLSLEESHHWIKQDIES